MDYPEVFRRAWKNVLDDFEAGETCIESEEDLQCLLFSECAKILATESSIRPIPIHAEVAVKILPSGGTTHTDLAVGPTGQVLVELKPNEWDYTNKAKKDLNKLKDAFQENSSVKSIFLCLTKNIDDEDGVRHYLTELPTRLGKEGFRVLHRVVRHPRHKGCHWEPSQEKHCAVLVWKQR